MSTRPIESLLVEHRTFAPPESFRAGATINDESVYDSARGDPEGFWAKAAGDLHWFRKWDKVLEWEVLFAKWFVGGRTNIAYNCLDRHLKTAREVNRCANALLAMGVQRGDRVAIYLGMIPELPMGRWPTGRRS